MTVAIIYNPTVRECCPEEISAIEPLAADPNYRRIRIGRRIAGTLRASDIDELGLETGLPWTAALAQRVAQAAAVAHARREAMRLLSRRALSSGELRDRLARKGMDDALIERTIIELQHDHWLDDAALARTLAEHLAERKSASHRLIVAKLRARRVDSTLAQEAANAVLSESDAEHKALQLGRTRLQRMRNIAPSVAARRIAGTLMRRGYAEDVVSGVLRKLDLNFGK